MAEWTEAWKGVVRKVIKDVGARGLVEMHKKSARINSSGYSLAQWVIGRYYKLPWSLQYEKSGEISSLETTELLTKLGRRTVGNQTFF